MSALRSATRFLLFSLLLPLAALAAAANDPRAVQGRLELPTLPQNALPLQGEWGFSWQQFVDPGWERLPGQALAPVPANWNAVPGKPQGENGWGSYFLLVNCPRGQSLAVEAFGQRTASRLFVNGTEATAHGEPGTTQSASWPAVHNHVPITREFACPLRITLHVSNFHHRAGGFVRPMYVGTVDVLESHRESRVIYDAALLTVYLLTGCAGLIFFAARRRDPVPLLFGLFCVAMAVYTDLIGERLLLRPLPAQVGWIPYMRAEYLSWLAAMALFLLTLRGLFPAEIARRVVWGVLAGLGLASVAVLVLPPRRVLVPGRARTGHCHAGRRVPGRRDAAGQGPGPDRRAGAAGRHGDGGGQPGHRPAADRRAGARPEVFAHRLCAVPAVARRRHRPAHDPGAECRGAQPHAGGERAPARGRRADFAP
jgi:hypothetical protein